MLACITTLLVARMHTRRTIANKVSRLLRVAVTHIRIQMPCIKAILNLNPNRIKSSLNIQKYPVWDIIRLKITGSCKVTQTLMMTTMHHQHRVSESALNRATQVPHSIKIRTKQKLHLVIMLPEILNLTKTSKVTFSLSIRANKVTLQEAKEM